MNDPHDLTIQKYFMSHKIHTFDTDNQPSEALQTQIIDFLFEHLEQYGDPKEDIRKCLNYTFKIGKETAGGFIILATDPNDIHQIKSAVVVNYTGMEGYVPANLLVYIATNKACRGQGLGAKVMEEVFAKAQGGIALHCEPNNPAKRLYERLGFSSKYLEMRRS